MRLLVSVVCAGAFVAPSALARSLQIQGVTGYLSEYELTADVSGQLAAGGTEELSGQLSVKHVGLCTHDGPNEMYGQLKSRENTYRSRGAAKSINALTLGTELRPAGVSK